MNKTDQYIKMVDAPDAWYVVDSHTFDTKDINRAIRDGRARVRLTAYDNRVPVGQIVVRAVLAVGLVMMGWIAAEWFWW
jgi:hypothetical protein